MNPIPFNKPYFIGNEIKYINQAIRSGKIAGNGLFTQMCQQFFEKQYGFKKCLLTNSCTDALEMAALLFNIEAGDEVIMPSYTFPSTANAFILRGAKVVFCDSEKQSPNIDVNKIESLVSKKTKAIVVVHYAGVSCDMDKILSLVKRHKLFLVEDASHAIDSYYKNKPLGSLGHFGCFSFHESKNIISGEGGMLVVNHQKFFKRADIILEKGTDRLAFLNGKVDSYRWQDIGSSFSPSDITAAFLFAQLKQLDAIQKKRKFVWNHYYSGLEYLEKMGRIRLPLIADFATNNAHMFYLICNSLKDRRGLIRHLKKKNIRAAFHYFPLHCSPFFKNKYDGRALPVSEMYSDCLIRLPLFCDMKTWETKRVISAIKGFYSG